MQNQVSNTKVFETPLQEPVQASEEASYKRILGRTVVGETTIIGSALFIFGFIITVTVVSFGGLMALSNNEFIADKALPILWVNFILIALLAIYLIQRTWAVLFSSRAGETAPQLHRRFVMLFSLAAMIPAVIVGVFFGAQVSSNVSDWYDDNVGLVVSEARQISESFMMNEIVTLRPDIYAMSQDLDRQSALLSDRITYNAYLVKQAVFREVPVVYIVRADGSIIGKAEQTSAPAYMPPTPEMIANANDGKLTVDIHGSVGMLLTLIKLNAYDDAYLYTGKYLFDDNLRTAISRIDNVESSLGRLTTGQGQINNIFLITYIQAAAIILMAAVWLGLALANRLVRPLGQMVIAAEKVRSGDLSTRVNVTGGWDEISDLAAAFNRMTSQLGSQRQELVREHNIAELRREFSEAVLSGVSAGVIGLSSAGRITLMNRSAEHLLGITAGRGLDQPLAEVLPEFSSAFVKAREAVQGMVEDQVDFESEMGVRNFDVRVSAYKGDGQSTGWVMTFDDMTRLVAAQRHSAWRDVARRIAHEIKNPLTPIQLSAERLERKYGKEISSDPETFRNLTQTIQRQVHSLGNIVDEFSAFARMPAPVMRDVYFKEFMETIVFAERVSFPDIEFRLTDHCTADDLVSCDERLMGQAMLNLLKNSGESVTARLDQTGTHEGAGRIDIELTPHGKSIRVDIIDNGKGWPMRDKDRLFEPYVTTRDSGTGLGLAIVKRIIEDHGGDLSLHDRKDAQQGARVSFTLPLSIASQQVANDRLSETSSKLAE